MSYLTIFIVLSILIVSLALVSLSTYGIGKQKDLGEADPGYQASLVGVAASSTFAFIALIVLMYIMYSSGKSSCSSSFSV